METPSSPKVNVYFYAENEEKVRALASRVLSNCEGNVYSDQFQGVNVFGYIRWPGPTIQTTRQGITDAIIVEFCSADSENFEQVQKYVHQRRSIPYKYITGSGDLSELAKSLDAQFIDANNFKERVLTEAVTLEKTLRDVFQKIDTNGNGFIEKDEIIAASKMMGQELTIENAKEISESLAANGQISFDKFKKWWVNGRTDFNTFRRILRVERMVNDYVQYSGALDLTKNKVQLKEVELDKDAEKSQAKGKFNIGPSQDFDYGTGVSVHVTLGDEFEGISNQLRAPLRENPASIGFELRLKRQEDGPLVIETLSSIKEMIAPMMDRLFEKGLEVYFSQTESSVFVDICYGGSIGDEMIDFFSFIDMSSLKFLAGLDLHLTSKFRPSDALNLDLDAMVQNAFNVKLEGSGEYHGLRSVFNFITQTLSTMDGNMSTQMKGLLYALRAFTAVRLVDFNFQFDVMSCFETVRDLTNVDGEGRYNRLREKFPNKQQELKEKLAGIAQMVGPMIEPFKAALFSLDLDNITAYGVCPIFKLFLKLSLKVRGITDLVAEYLA